MDCVSVRFGNLDLEYNWCETDKSYIKDLSENDIRENEIWKIYINEYLYKGDSKWSTIWNGIEIQINYEKLDIEIGKFEISEFGHEISELIYMEDVYMNYD